MVFFSMYFELFVSMYQITKHISRYNFKHVIKWLSNSRICGAFSIEGTEYSIITLAVSEVWYKTYDLL